MEGHLGYVLLSAHRLDVLTRPRFPQYPYLVLRRLSFLFHVLGPFLGTQTVSSSGSVWRDHVKVEKVLLEPLSGMTNQWKRCSLDSRLATSPGLHALRRC